MDNGYLTETSLGEKLSTIFNRDFIHNKCFNRKYRPDFRNDELKLIVEFDGYKHYSNTKRIVDDYKKDELYSSYGYKNVHIPYFVQFSKETVRFLFGSYDIVDDESVYSKYPHGFIDDSALLPCNFCYLGTERFLNDIQRFIFINVDIINSLYDKIRKIGDWRLVINEKIKDELGIIT